jgi:phosphatidate cytidylyltransferase
LTGDPAPASPPPADGPPPGAAAPAAVPAAVSTARVGVGLLLGVVVVLVLLLDALLGSRSTSTFRTAAPGTGLLLALLSGAALREFYALLARAGIPSHAAYGAVASCAILAGRALLPALGMRPGDAAAAAEVAMLLAILAPAASAVGFRAKGAPEEGAAAVTPEALRACAGTALGFLAVHLPLSLLLELRLVPAVSGMSTKVPAGLVLATMAALACKIGDSAAYFAGRTIGKRPLCWVSPKKTWEGAVAGALAGTGAAALLGAVFGLPLAHGLAFGLTVNLAGQGGDLLESWWKRCCGAKDSGTTFGEMGGALDLVDALLLAGPAGYLFHRVVLA